MIKITDIDWVSGQEPTGRDQWAADMRVTGQISGTKDVARLLGVQQRVLARHIDEGTTRDMAITQPKLLRMLTSDRGISSDLLKKIRHSAQSFASAYALNEFGSDARVEQVEYLDDQLLSFASFSPDDGGTVEFEVEVGTHGNWRYPNPRATNLAPREANPARVHNVARRLANPTG